MVKAEKPLCKEKYLSQLYKQELEYINKIMLYQEYHYNYAGEIILLVDYDFPGFRSLTERKIAQIIFLYQNAGWSIRLEELDSRKEFLLVFS